MEKEESTPQIIIDELSYITDEQWNDLINRLETKMINKYYVGAKHIGSAIARRGDPAGTAYTVPTMEDAIEQAKETIRNGEAECLVVVKIVAVIRREVPITVQVVE